MPFVQTERLKVHYGQFGRGPKPIIMMHGNLVSQKTWLKTVERLPLDQYTIYTVDMNGSGATPETGKNHNIPGFAEDLKSFVDALSLKDFHLVGHSLGGGVCQQFVLNYPGLAQTLVLLGPCPAEGLYVPPENLVLVVAMKDDKNLFMDVLKTTMPTADFADPNVTDIGEEAFRSSSEVFCENAKCCGEWSIIDRLQEITLPTLLIRGAEDTWVPREPLVKMSEILPDVEWVEIPGVGHCPNIECPDVFVKALMDFWAKH